MAFLNEVNLIGNIGHDLELKTLESGLNTVTFSVATTSKWTDSETGDKREHTDWHRVVLFNGLSKIAAEYLKKGSLVYIQGRLQNRKWEKDGVTHSITEVIGTNLQML